MLFCFCLDCDDGNPTTKINAQSEQPLIQLTSDKTDQKIVEEIPLIHDTDDKNENGPESYKTAKIVPDTLTIQDVHKIIIERLILENYVFNIPNEIINLCFIFYYLIPNYDQESKLKSMKLLKESNSAFIQFLQQHICKASDDTVVTKIW